MSENNLQPPEITGDEIKRRRKELKLTQEQLADRLGVSKRTVINYENGEAIPKSKIAILHQALYKSESVGEMLVREPFEKFVLPNKNGNIIENLPDGTFIMRVPLIPIKAYAKYISEGDNADELEGYDHRYFHVDHFGKGKYRAFEIKGDSMDDGQRDYTPDKAIALGRELGKQHWRDGFRDSQYGWIIVSKNNIVFKDITNFDSSSGMITCHSRNPSPEYSDFQLSLDEDVHSIFKVIKRQF